MPVNNIMGEKEILGDVLNTEKDIFKVYSSAITETSCANMRQLLMRNITQISDDQFNVYNMMVNKGYYQAKDAQEQDVQKAKQKFQQMQSQL